MESVDLPFDDWLLLAGSPADTGLHFVGTFDRRITFYSQQVRALRLVHALSKSDKLKPSDTIAVVGAGAAGVTAALGLALLGNDVTLYDPATSILQLQSASPRLLHPHIYEWPELGSLDDRAGLPFLDWVAGTGGEVCSRLKADFDAANARLTNLSFKDSHSLSSVEKVDARWRLGLSTNAAMDFRQFDHVILAIGFGNEIPCGSAKPVHYWKQNSVGSTAAEPLSPATYIVSGNGDGGLTDLLNLLVENFEHVGFTKQFLDYFSNDTLRAETESAYAGISAGGDLEAAFTARLLPLFTELNVIDRIGQMLRADRQVTINSLGPLFAAGQAAQLNQVMAFAVLAAATHVDRPVGRSSGQVTDATGNDGAFQVAGLSVDGVSLTQTFQHVVLRHGPDRADRYKPAGSHFETYRTHILELLAARPELVVPPVLAPDTYEFFEVLRMNKLEDHASRLASEANAESAKSTLFLGIDRATRLPVEQGRQRLLDVADQCERLASNVSLHLAASPSTMPAFDDIVRLARASGGRITLSTLPEWLGAWQKTAPAIGTAPSAASHYPCSTLAIDGLDAAIDACLLRLLDQRIQAALANHNCETLGPINPTITAAIAPTWTTWHASLNADKALLGAFLSWLASVEQHTRTVWTGDHDRIPQLATALIMMLATHHGEALEPALVERGNLKFSLNALALGSGCEMVGQQPISVWDQPDQWGVDALILSGSSEIEVSDPPGRIFDAGKFGLGMTTARRVRPVVIRNDKHWRARLTEDLTTWRTAIETEFAALRDRQDQELQELTK
ncbi:ABC-three component system protein [uncultured Parasphingorhabdus sp.]|uniref:ABC-three component system protein n=1 Tax=uncultured Parasphingorhabdus sp. TaxID=2709694 RepID=UPI0030D95AAA|tara:strand:+ start:29732 stop:32107 length:2376 start_codon:yes stop_codon:yes gene_type:complete